MYHILVVLQYTCVHCQMYVQVIADSFSLCRAVLEGVAKAIYVAAPLLFFDQVQVHV